MRTPLLAFARHRLAQTNNRTKKAIPFRCRFFCVFSVWNAEPLVWFACAAGGLPQTAPEGLVPLDSRPSPAGGIGNRVQSDEKIEYTEASLY